MLAVKEIIINKNRGWRGLAELIVRDATHTEQTRMIFSFSQDMWDDMLNGRIVIQDHESYYVLMFDNLERLPRKDQQRSVLIKNFMATVFNVNRYEKSDWSNASMLDYLAIMHFIKNKNNHTQSDWNCIRTKSNTKNINNIYKQ
jgi:3-methyladenine DNA glycosylase AlkD